MRSQARGKTRVGVVRQLGSVEQQVKQVSEVLLQSCLVQVVVDDAHQAICVIASRGNVGCTLN